MLDALNIIKLPRVKIFHASTSVLIFHWKTLLYISSGFFIPLKNQVLPIDYHCGK